MRPWEGFIEPQEETLITAYFLSLNTKLLTRFNTIGIQATAQIAVEKEPVCLSKVHMYEYKGILLLRDNCLIMLLDILILLE